ncbi:MAG TPA: MBL fold metallo-hydrolase [Flavobacterium sp.]|jgi:glyoxylase-like metal-dependent hydrolase (beta-lactamase superfamily II)
MKNDNMHDMPDSHSIPMTSVSSGKTRQVKPDVHYYTDQIANLIFLGDRNSGRWSLVDAGMPNSAHNIVSEAEELFGKGTKPQAILLTHGHFDHVGSLIDLLELWKDVPVYAHQLEFPFLTGQLDYPEPDTSVEGGMLAKISKLYPHKAINITPVLQPLHENGTVPGFPDWKWLHTPGHAPGHVSFFRESDRMLIAGDAFVTVRQDSFYKVLVQQEEVNGPPRYLTTNWPAAKASVLKLHALHPESVVTGHGTHMEGERLREGLDKLVREWDDIALPDHGKFVDGND